MVVFVKLFPVIYCLAAISGTNACVPFDLARKYRCRQTRILLELCGRPKHSKQNKNIFQRFKITINTLEAFARCLKVNKLHAHVICISGSAAASNEMVIHHVWITKDSQTRNLTSHSIKKRGRSKKRPRLMQMKIMHRFRTNRL